MDKNFKIFGVRSGMIGDMIMALPILNYLELVYPNSYKYWVIGQRFSQAAPLFINQILIDKIHILSSSEGVMAEKDINLAQSCDIYIDVTPSHPDGIPCVNSFWWNEYNLCEETFRMTGLNVEKYRKMPEEFKNPRLERWFNISPNKKTIGIWPFAAYGKEPMRSPTKEWWEYLIPKLLDLGYTPYIFGHPNEPTIFESDYRKSFIYDYRRLSFFEQIKLSLECDLSINTDSGSGWVLGAYGHKQISLITNHAPNHTQNLLAFAPENYKNNNINLFEFGGCSNIKHDLVINSIDKLICK